MPDILITENICGIAVDALSSRFDVTFLPELWEEPTELLKRIGDFRAIIVRNQTQVTASLLKAGKKLVVVGRAGVGLDNVDVDAATQARHPHHINSRPKCHQRSGTCNGFDVVAGSYDFCYKSRHKRR